MLLSYLEKRDVYVMHYVDIFDSYNMCVVILVVYLLYYDL